MYSQLLWINRLAFVVMLIGVFCVVYMTVSLFKDSLNEPLAVILGQAMIFSGDISSGLLTQTYQGWSSAIYKITGFMSAFLYLLLASYTFYYRGMVNIETLQHVRKMAKTVLVSYLLVGLLHSAFIGLFAFKEEI